MDYGTRVGAARSPEFLGTAMTVRDSIRRSSAWALALVIANYALFLVFGTPLLTDWLAEWIMARTPNTYAVAILDALGEWAKPFAATGGLAILGFSIFCLDRLVLLAARFTRPRAGALPDHPDPARRQMLRNSTSAALPLLLGAGTVGVAVESWARNRSYARHAIQPTKLWDFHLPPGLESFAPGLVRPAITSTNDFYGMSKNTVDPVIQPMNWRLRITIDGHELRSFTFADLLALPRTVRVTTMRCVSNTLKSNLMGTAEWAGVQLRQLVDPSRIPSSVVEVAFIGQDGHDDSVPIGYAFSDDLLLALGMNGATLNRVHGFPLRLLAPRYYGFKSVKWLSEIRFVTRPYFGTWPKMGYTKEPVVHTMSAIDRVARGEGKLRVGGVSFAGLRGINRVQIRANAGPWQDVQLEAPLSRYTWTRWKGELLIPQTPSVIEARALDGTGAWQSDQETPLFPNGVQGPTIKRLS